MTEGMVKEGDGFSLLMYNEFLMNTEHYRALYDKASREASDKFVKGKSKEELAEDLYNKIIQCTNDKQLAETARDGLIKCS
jgi:uncharacterized phage-like protein YoqJ